MRQPLPGIVSSRIKASFNLGGGVFVCEDSHASHVVANVPRDIHPFRYLIILSVGATID